MRRHAPRRIDGEPAQPGKLFPQLAVLVFHAQGKTFSGLMYVKGKIAQEHPAVQIIRLQLSRAYGFSTHGDGHIGIHMHSKVAVLRVDRAGFGRHRRWQYKIVAWRGTERIDSLTQPYQGCVSKIAVIRGDLGQAFLPPLLNGLPVGGIARRRTARQKSHCKEQEREPGDYPAVIHSSTSSVRRPPPAAIWDQTCSWEMPSAACLPADVPPS